MQLQSDVDVVRSALCCLCYEEEYVARPVHRNHINSFLHQYLTPERADFALETVAFLQEFARLPHGYWYPAPLRQIPWIDASIIIGPHSTEELQRALHLPIKLAGNARVLTDQKTERLPVQNLDDWLDRPPDLAAWGRIAFTRGRLQLVPTMTSGGTIDIYVPTEPSRWIILGSRTRMSDGIYLCRRWLSEHHKPYFLGELRSNRLHAETVLTEDHIRLRYAIDLSQGVRNSYTCRFQQEKVQLKFGYRLPPAERRLMLAMGSSALPDCKSPSFEIPRVFLPAVEFELKRLGLLRGAARA